MSFPHPLVEAAWFAALIAVAASLILMGRVVARALQQPAVIGEITAGLLGGPLALWLLGRHHFDQVLPAHLMNDLSTLARTGLVLYLLALVHGLRRSRRRIADRAVGWVTLYSFLPALATGLMLGLLVLEFGSSALRGAASTPAFLLYLAVALSITAVPVLARILTDRGMQDTEPGRVSLTAAVATDSLSWIALTAALTLQSGSAHGMWRALTGVAVGAVGAWVVRTLLGLTPASRAAARYPVPAALLAAGVAYGFSAGITHAGLTPVLGAVLASYALPTPAASLAAPEADAESVPSGGWTASIALLEKAGRLLLPLYFVVSGITVLTKSYAYISPAVVVLAILLGVLGKFAGGFLGARRGGFNRADALRVGTLMNTRGLTELVALQVGYSAGIITAPLYLALVVMALTTTAATNPMLQLIDRAQLRNRPRRPRTSYAPSDIR